MATFTYKIAWLKCPLHGTSPQRINTLERVFIMTSDTKVNPAVMFFVFFQKPLESKPLRTLYKSARVAYLATNPLTSESAGCLRTYAILP